MQYSKNQTILAETQVVLIFLLFKNKVKLSLSVFLLTKTSNVKTFTWRIQYWKTINDQHIAASKHDG